MTTPKNGQQKNVHTSFMVYIGQKQNIALLPLFKRVCWVKNE
jgi:hypothetical protein